MKYSTLQLYKILLYGFIVVPICYSQEDYSILPKIFRFTPEQRNYIRESLLNIIGRSGDSKTSLEKISRLGRLQKVMSKFPCNVTGFRSEKRPESIHKLRPGDIDVVGALGDSLTAGNGVVSSNLFQVFVENRGTSWAIGGQGTWREFLTLPNILKEFNPKLVGYSLSDSFTHNRNSQFNVAEIGAMSRDLPYMASILVKRIKNDKRVNFNKDWKLITLEIGSNDFCSDVCYRKDMYRAPELHRKDLIATIEYLKENLPRTLLQIVVTPNLRSITEFNGLPPICSLTLTSECPCLIGLPFSYKRKDMFKIMEEWQKVEVEVGMVPTHTTEDFAVVTQPFAWKLLFPVRLDNNGNTVTDITYLSHDCFHLSQKANARAANALWNNLLQPIGRKLTAWETEFSNFLCPTEEDPYIFTIRNS
ncbi:phospholipase B1, membrane-associated-like isoform X2 [Lycorma delicatula]|uniref:phospholipase B1, membrane-associated-like isoform X2 n=1 Tax=Lycorma delicatula TaxID=130591 RepID=UPI003F518052